MAVQSLRLELEATRTGDISTISQLRQSFGKEVAETADRLHKEYDARLHGTESDIEARSQAEAGEDAEGPR